MQKASLCMSRPIGVNRQNGQSLDEYKQIKILPHINEQYQYRITNRLLIEKIIKPRRDKIIIDSLTHTSYNQIYKKKKVFTRNLSTINNRRKLIRTATMKIRQRESFQNVFPQNQHQKSYNKPQFTKKLEKELQKMNFDKEKNGQQRMKYKKDQFTQSKRIDSQESQQKDNLSYSRDHFIGKIVRNNSNLSNDIRKNDKRQQKEKRLTPKSNRPIITNNFIREFNNQCEKPKQTMKRLIKRIYQTNNKQNNEQIINTDF